ncbi:MULTISPECIES: DUF2997 domain-containing protein [Argonema]|uniref:DUF2997 domain-containing protein n=1 Tax=Argonema TaxID=2942761 RepID=UPI0020127474|nr:MULTISPECIES: DUF2997 domain-containing protein [Argonema]MCL1463434.1 DUF2997 domain-containing protein [Argonema galeatum A003/A1]MCL1472426.1 DUF2997 domain-containing protein [Argonema antarcticum A004/B2]
MAEYRKIEYRIGTDGKITETVLNASGSTCTETTSGIEKALGKVESQKLFPEYYQEDEDLINEETQSQTEM